MKKILFTALLLISAGIAQAQLTVSANGDVVIGSSSPILNSALTIDGTKKVSIKRSVTNTSGYVEGLKSEVQRIGSEYAIGVYGLAEKASSSNSYYTGRCYGVLGIGSGGQPGHSYGVAGVIPVTTTGGVGVYGSACGVIGMDPGDEYAGFFYGDVKTLGNLYVTGNISGVLLTPTSNLNIIQDDDINSGLKDNHISEKLNQIHTKLYLYKTNRPIKDDNTSNYQMTNFENVDNNTEEISVDNIPLSFIEKQIYSRQHYGLSADELEAIFPDLVYENEDGSKSINYVEMVPILVQAIGELKSEINELRGNESARKVSAKATGINDVDGSVEVLALGQNKPNPFGSSTELEVSVPESVQSAFVYVYDLQGKKVQQVDITARGKQTVELNAIGLSDGMYLYSLIADGKVVETRRMIVEK